MGRQTADVVICGAGIAGISAAYHLSVKHGVGDVLLVDEHPPLSLTSDKSTECYRNWWPGPGDAMVSMTNRSIDILEAVALETGNALNLNRRGYLFVTSDPGRVEDFKTQAEEAASLGAGPVRYHSGGLDDPEYQPAPPFGFEGQPTGSDLITDPALIQEHFPYLSEETVAVVHARRCGWFSAHQLGMILLERARERGVRLIQSRVEGVEVRNRAVEGVQLGSGDGPVRIATQDFVIAAGPFLKSVGSMLGVELPVFCEYHAKLAFNDHLGLFPREAPLLIWTDRQRLPWSEEERAAIANDEEAKFLLGEFPDGVHGRPEGPLDSPIALMLWTYQMDPVEPVFPPPVDLYYPEVVLRGMATMIPAMKAYFGRAPKPIVDGGYYTKTGENRPLIGPLPLKGAWAIGALSGFGLMASPAAGELLAAHLTDDPLPSYAQAFLPSRYEDPEYQTLLKSWGRSGQL